MAHFDYQAYIPVQQWPNMMNEHGIPIHERVLRLEDTYSAKIRPPSLALSLDNSVIRPSYKNWGSKDGLITELLRETCKGVWF